MAELDQGLSANGIRKFCATRMKENGASDGEGQALFGWPTMKQVDLYTKKLNRARLEDSAVERLDREEQNGYFYLAVGAGATKRPKKALKGGVEAGSGIEPL